MTGRPARAAVDSGADPGARAALSEAIAPHRDGAALTVVVAPRAGRTAFVRVEHGALRIAVAAPPVDGAANEALLRFVADAAGVPKSRVCLVSGTSGRAKRLVVDGVDPDDLARRLSRQMPASGS